MSAPPCPCFYRFFMSLYFFSLHVCAYLYVTACTHCIAGLRKRLLEQEACTKAAKQRYSGALAMLERISQEIHAQRQARDQSKKEGRHVPQHEGDDVSSAQGQEQGADAQSDQASPAKIEPRTVCPVFDVLQRCSTVLFNFFFSRVSIVLSLC